MIDKEILEYKPISEDNHKVKVCWSIIHWPIFNYRDWKLEDVSEFNLTLLIWLSRLST